MCIWQLFNSPILVEKPFGSYAIGVIRANKAKPKLAKDKKNRSFWFLTKVRQITLKIISSFLFVYFFAFFRYCLCQQFSLVQCKTSKPINIASLKIVIANSSSKKNITSSTTNDHGGYLPNFQIKQKGRVYCLKEGKERRTFVICSAYDMLLHLTMEGKNKTTCKLLGLCFFLFFFKQYL